MDQFIGRYARTGSMRLRDFIRAYNAEGHNMFRGEVVAELARRGFSVAIVANQSYIIGLSPQSENSALREFINENAIRADGLTCKLSAIVRASGLPRTQVIQQLQEYGFEVEKNGTYVVRGLGLKECA